MTEGYVDLDIVHNKELTKHPFAIRSDNKSGRSFHFNIVHQTRSRRTRANFLQWHVKGAKVNYGVQLANEPQAIKLESVVAKAISEAKDGVTKEQRQLSHLARTGQTTQAFQLLNDGAGPESGGTVGKEAAPSLMVRVHLPDSQSTMLKVAPKSSLVG